MRSELAHQQELREQVILFLFETWQHDAQSHLLVPADSAADRPSTFHGLCDPGPHLVQFSAVSSQTHEASELKENTEVHPRSTERAASLGAELQPPDPNVGPTAVGSLAAMPREKYTSVYGPQ